MARHNEIGEWGERVAAEYFLQRGYAVVARNLREGPRLNELDLIVSKGNRIIFVEAKTRTDASSDPLLAVDRRKKARIIRAAVAYLQAHPTPLEPQFDLFLVTGTEDNYSTEHLEDVFLPPLITYTPGGCRIQV